MALLHDQTAVVSGAGSGIGEGVARAFAAAGAAVVVNYRRRADEAERIVDDIRAGGGRAIAVQADVSDETDVDALFEAAVTAFGRVDIVVANAGLQEDAAFADLTLHQWRKVIDVNLTGQFLCARAGVRRFLAQEPRPDLSKARGKIIHMSSVHDVIPWAGHVNYAASKGGVMLLMKSLAQEVAEKGIRVNAISPGAIATPINQSVWSDPEQMKALLRLIPYGRIGRAEDVAKAAVWLASDESDYVTGTTLYVDGGMTLYPEFRDNG
jgi:glucose 1-dehydrogenase